MKPKVFIEKEILNKGISPVLYNNLLMASHYDGFYWAAKKYNINIVKNGSFFLFFKKGRLIGSIKDMKSSFVSLSAYSICNNKSVTNLILKEVGIPTPKQIKIDKSKGFVEEEMNFFPLVLKPLNGKGGESVYFPIHNKEEFIKIYNMSVMKNSPKTEWVVEEYIEGFDVRATIVNDRFSCACVRVPAFVVGDGSSEVKSLVEKKNEERKKHPHHKNFLISFRDELANLIPKKGEIFLISNIPNIHQGGEAFDVTDIICDELKYLAEKTVRAIPGLKCAGVDLLVNDLNTDKNASVIEVNTASNYAIHYYPYYGKKRNPAEDLVKEMLIGY